MPMKRTTTLPPRMGKPLCKSSHCWQPRRNRSQTREKADLGTLHLSIRRWTLFQLICRGTMRASAGEAGGNMLRETPHVVPELHVRHVVVHAPSRSCRSATFHSASAISFQANSASLFPTFHFALRVRKLWKKFGPRSPHACAPPPVLLGRGRREGGKASPNSPS